MSLNDIMMFVKCKLFITHNYLHTLNISPCTMQLCKMQTLTVATITISLTLFIALMCDFK